MGNKNFVFKLSCYIENGSDSLKQYEYAKVKRGYNPAELTFLLKQHQIKF